MLVACDFTYMRSVSLGISESNSITVKRVETLVSRSSAPAASDVDTSRSITSFKIPYLITISKTLILLGTCRHWGAFDNRVIALGDIGRGGMLVVIGPRSISFLLSCKLNLTIDINFEK